MFRNLHTALNKVITKLTKSSGQYVCPICNKRSDSFLPLPNYYIENQQKFGWRYSYKDAEMSNAENFSCPFCGANDRDRLYALYIRGAIEKLHSDETVRIIDFAPSSPLSLYIEWLIKEAYQKITYTTADLHLDNVDDRVDIMDMNIYQDNFFDFFICSHVLEHVRDDKKALRELHRILKVDGKGILMVPIILSIDNIDEDPDVIEESEKWRRFGQCDHVRLYSKKGFIKRTAEAGFKVRQLGYEFFGKDVFSRHAINQQSILYVVEKKNF